MKISRWKQVSKRKLKPGMRLRAPDNPVVESVCVVPSLSNILEIHTDRYYFYSPKSGKLKVWKRGARHARFGRAK